MWFSGVSLSSDAPGRAEHRAPLTASDWASLKRSASTGSWPGSSALPRVPTRASRTSRMKAGCVASATGSSSTPMGHLEPSPSPATPTSAHTRPPATPFAPWRGDAEWTNYVLPGASATADMVNTSAFVGVAFDGEHKQRNTVNGWVSATTRGTADQGQGARSRSRGGLRRSLVERRVIDVGHYTLLGALRAASRTRSSGAAPKGGLRGLCVGAVVGRALVERERPPTRPRPDLLPLHPSGRQLGRRDQIQPRRLERALVGERAQTSLSPFTWITDGPDRARAAVVGAESADAYTLPTANAALHIRRSASAGPVYTSRTHGLASTPRYERHGRTPGPRRVACYGAHSQRDPRR